MSRMALSNGVFCTRRFAQDVVFYRLEIPKAWGKLSVRQCHSSYVPISSAHFFRVLIYNLVRRVIWEAAHQQEVPPDRISFIDAWRWLRFAYPGDALPVLVVNPQRPGRVEPRVRKRRPKQFPVMKQPRDILRKALMRKKVAA